MFILKKVIKILASKSYLLKLICTKFDLCCGCAPRRPRWGSSQRSLDLLAEF